MSLSGGAARLGAHSGQAARQTSAAQPLEKFFVGSRICSRSVPTDLLLTCKPPSALMSGNRKRPRVGADSLQRVLHLGGTSVVGLHELLQSLRSVDPAVLDVKHWELRAARDSLFNGLRLVLEMPLASGDGTFAWELADPLLLLPRAVECRSDIRMLFAAAVRRSLPTAERPWRLAIGFDAFTPGMSLIESRSGLRCQ